MLRGLYTSASGMAAEQMRQDTIANNLANVSTTGFKKDEAVFKAFPNHLLQRIHDRMDEAAAGQGSLPLAFAQPTQLGMMGQGNSLDATVTNFSDGSVQRTDRPLDLALQGNALFTVERADGSTAYTRSGSFSLNSEKQLVTQGGELVLGTSGQPIVLDGSEVVIDPTGQVLLDGQQADKLQLAAYDAQRMQKLGDNLYVRTADDLEGVGEENPVEAHVQQGFLEQANVNVVTEMVRMISVMRSYEANQKTIQMQDQSLSKAINEVGRPA
jgi:flagellar basal-body rod protein FlgG